MNGVHALTRSANNLHPMGLLDSLIGSLTGGGNNGGQLLSLVTGLIQNQGGLDGLVSKFTSAGLGNVVQSWISKGPNLPIGPEQIQQVFGQQDLASLGQSVGLGVSDTASGLSKILPNVVDQLTPDGTSIGGAALDSALKNLAAGSLGKLFG
ncbi:MAG: DUF937 domain-containing protein [Verrucomicrobiae bacterium]|nr:DUF937 domain-containing protein [Verrucomicrobiae bacterium]